jgi:hypothetical protein
VSVRGVKVLSIAISRWRHGRPEESAQPPPLRAGTTGPPHAPTRPANVPNKPQLTSDRLLSPLCLCILGYGVPYSALCFNPLVSPREPAGRTRLDEGLDANTTQRLKSASHGSLCVGSRAAFGRISEGNGVGVGGNFRTRRRVRKLMRERTRHLRSCTR